jgi:hypothetical protein
MRAGHGRVYGASDGTTPGASEAPTESATKLEGSASWRLVVDLRKPRGSNLNVG